MCQTRFTENDVSVQVTQNIRYDYRDDARIVVLEGYCNNCNLGYPLAAPLIEYIQRTNLRQNDPIANECPQMIKCNIRNEYKITSPSKITVVKNVINHDRGTKKPSDFTIFITGNSPSPNNFHGSTSGTSISIQPGTYKVIEDAISGYATTYSSDCSGSITTGKTVNCVVTNDDIPPPPFVNTQNVKLGGSTFLQSALIPLADVGPSSNIIGGHVSISSPTGSSSDHLKLVAAEIADAGVQHAVTVNFTKTLDITTTGQSLYHVDMRTSLAGINPFTGAADRVTHFTALLLWNNGTSNIVFNGDDYVTIAIIYAGR